MDTKKQIENATTKMALRSAVDMMGYFRQRGIEKDGSLTGGVFPQNQGMSGNQAA